MDQERPGAIEPQDALHAGYVTHTGGSHMRIVSLLSWSVVLLMACVVSSPVLANLVEDFDDPTHAAQWTTWHEACFASGVDAEPHANVLALTQAGTNIGDVGQAWYSSKLPSRQFAADFQFQIQWGQGSSNWPHCWPAGITFGWVSDINESWGAGWGAYHNEHMNGSWIYGYPGHFVTFSAFEQERWGHGQVFAVESSATSGPIVATAVPPPTWVSHNWYDARVRLDPAGTDARVRMWLESDGDGRVEESFTPMLDYSISNYAMDTAYFGFTGAAAWADTHQRIDNVRISSGPTVPEPASCALLALAVGGIGATLKKRRKKA